MLREHHRFLARRSDQRQRETLPGVLSGATATLLGMVLALFAACSSQPHDPAGNGGFAKSTATGNGGLEEITVSASRADRRDGREREVQADRAVASQQAMARVSGFAPSTNAAVAQLDVAPLSRVQPGEELWIIATGGHDAATQSADQQDDTPGTGSMLAIRSLAPELPPEEVPLPLKHTDVRAAVTGYIGTVDVTQQFENPYNEKIEAVYLFPLPERAAVSEFVMTVGERKIRGILREKEQAEQIYREARAQGYRASLLVQHRPNIFEQKVANIEPGKRIDVNIRYFHTLAYEDGWYAFVFPMVVGPRYNPRGATDPVVAVPRTDIGASSAGTAVRYLRPSERSGHDLSISVDIDAGVAIEELTATHAISTVRHGDSAARVELASGSTVPNRDFVLSFRVAGDTIKSNLLTYTDPKSEQSYFTLMLYPPARLEGMRRRPMEMVFVLDTSGSMAGRPLEQAVDAVQAALEHLRPSDTFQILNFSDSVRGFGAGATAATEANLDAARRYLHALASGGGTEMLSGIRAALWLRPDPQRARVVTFLTDGYIGNEADILGEVHRLIGAARIFSFGVGDAVNRYLLDGLATEGRGAAAYLGLSDSAGDVMRFFFERISHPALTDVAIDWRGLRVADVYPAGVPDLLVGRPVVITGKFNGSAQAIAVRGRAAQSDVAFEVAVAQNAPERAAIRNIWARLRIEDFARRQTWGDEADGGLAAAIRSTALEHGLMSAYTSFVAVDASERTAGDRGTTVYQAVPVPNGVRYETTVAGER
jgi:Ca-activated chloride channel family protein